MLPMVFGMQQASTLRAQARGSAARARSCDALATAAIVNALLARNLFPREVLETRGATDRCGAS